MSEPGEAGETGVRDGDDLEELAHAAIGCAPGQPLHAASMEAARSRRCVALERIGAGCEAQRLTGTRPASIGPSTAAPWALAVRGKSREIDMDGEVRLARLGQHIHESVRLDRLERVAEGRSRTWP